MRTIQTSQQTQISFLSRIEIQDSTHRVHTQKLRFGFSTCGRVNFRIWETNSKRGSFPDNRIALQVTRTTPCCISLSLEEINPGLNNQPMTEQRPELTHSSNANTCQVINTKSSTPQSWQISIVVAVMTLHVVCVELELPSVGVCRCVAFHWMYEVPTGVQLRVHGVLMTLCCKPLCSVFRVAICWCVVEMIHCPWHCAGV